MKGGSGERTGYTKPKSAQRDLPLKATLLGAYCDNDTWYYYCKINEIVDDTYQVPLKEVGVFRLDMFTTRTSEGETTNLDELIDNVVRFRWSETDLTSWSDTSHKGSDETEKAQRRLQKIKDKRRVIIKDKRDITTFTERKGRISDFAITPPIPHVWGSRLPQFITTPQIESYQPQPASAAHLNMGASVEL
jgi:hypothetical protein